MESVFYKIKALTNMHVGSGDTNYGVIDNLVQRDVVSDLPTIHGSSLKGALREFFETKWGNNDNKLEYIFGKNEQAGKYRFLSAHLLAMPVRSNKKAFFMATAPEAIKGITTFMKELGKKKTPAFLNELKSLNPATGKPIVFVNKDDLQIEDFEDFEQKNVPFSPETKNALNISDNLVIFSDEDFTQICGNTNLPVIARNKLGENKNLWYEQVVPRESVFWAAVILPESKQHLTDFEAGFEDIVHIGANASVGYGFTKISKI